MVRFKNRYLLCEVEFGADDATSDRLKQNLTGRDVLNTIRKSLEENYGSLGAAKACGPSLAIKYWSPMLGLAVVRTARDEASKVRAAATLVFDQHGAAPKKMRISVRHVAGTIRSCQTVAAIVAKETVRRRMDNIDAVAAVGQAPNSSDRKRKWERVQTDALRDLSKLEP